MSAPDNVEAATAAAATTASTSASVPASQGAVVSPPPSRPVAVCEDAPGVAARSAADLDVAAVHASVAFGLAASDRAPVAAACDAMELCCSLAAFACGESLKSVAPPSRTNGHPPEIPHEEKLALSY